MAMSSAVGAVAGAGLSQSNNETGRVKDAIGGAILGGIGGAAFLTKTGLKATAGTAFSAAFGTAKAGLRAAPTVGQAGVGAAGFALRNPKATIAMGLGAGAAYSLATSGPGTTSQDKSFTLMKTGASSTGYSPGMGSSIKQEARQMFMDSANGLVQGMHAGRHQ